jgi:hypothetical protein
MAHGGTLSDYGRLRPGEAREIVERLDSMDMELQKAESEAADARVRAILKGIEVLVKAVDKNTKVTARAFGGK